MAETTEICAIDLITQAIIAELRKQEPDKGGTYFFDPTDLHAAVIDGFFDLPALARAMLQALREPSPAVAMAGYDWFGDSNFRPSEVRDLWQAMIDAALAV